MIPSFPTFRPISPELYSEYRGVIESFQPYSDTNIVSLTSWDRSNTARISRLFGNMVVQFPDYTDNRPVTTIVGNTDLPETATRLVKSGDRVCTKLELVPEYIAAVLHTHSDWLVCEDASNHDYVLSIPRLSSLTGSEVREFRQSVHLFERRHGAQASFHTLDLQATARQRDIIEVFLTRESQKSGVDYEHELSALKQLFAYAGHFSLQAFGITIDRQLQAYAIVEALDDAWGIAYFWKANTRYNGIYAYLLHRVACELSGQGVKQLNFEQDLGLEGLRVFKRSLAPIGYLRKYTVEAKPPSGIVPVISVSQSALRSPSPALPG